MKHKITKIKVKKGVYTFGKDEDGNVIEDGGV
jgi:hypothetical protein